VPQRSTLGQSTLTGKTKIGTLAGGIFLSGLQAVSETLFEFTRTHLAANLLAFIANREGENGKRESSDASI
jgi:hypothetical protein